MNPTNFQPISITNGSYREFQYKTVEDIKSVSEQLDDLKKRSNAFKYNCHTRSNIIKRSKKYKAKAKLQKLARRKNRK